MVPGPFREFKGIWGQEVIIPRAMKEPGQGQAFGTEAAHGPHGSPGHPGRAWGQRVGDDASLSLEPAG